MPVVMPLPGPEPFSIAPALSAFAQGQATKVALEDRVREREQQAQDAIIRAAQLADTPEKWDRFITTIQGQFPDADLSEFTDFSSRDAAIAQSMDPYQRASLDLQERDLAFRQQQATAAANAPAAITPRTPVGEINADYQNGLFGDPASPEAMQIRDRLVQSALTGEAESPVVVNGQLVRPSTGEVIGDYRDVATAEPPETLKLVQDDGEIHEMGWNPETRQYDIDYGVYRGTPLVEGDEAPMPAALVNEAIDASNRSDSLYAQVQELQNFRDVARTTPTGFWADATLGIRTALADLGIINDPNIPGQQLLQAMANQQALRLRNPDSGFGLTGNTSNRDISFLTNAVARLGNTPEGNEAILTIMIAKQRREAQLEAERSDYIWENGDLQGWNEYRTRWIEENPFLLPEEERALAALSGQTVEQIREGTAAPQQFNPAARPGVGTPANQAQPAVTPEPAQTPAEQPAQEPVGDVTTERIQRTIDAWIEAGFTEQQALEAIANSTGKTVDEIRRIWGR